jgi:hypothetical protein
MTSSFTSSTTCSSSSTKGFALRSTDSTFFPRLYKKNNAPLTTATAPAKTGKIGKGCFFFWGCAGECRACDALAGWETLGVTAEGGFCNAVYAKL